MKLVLAILAIGVVAIEAKKKPNLSQHWCDALSGYCSDGYTSATLTISGVRYSGNPCTLVQKYCAGGSSSGGSSSNTGTSSNSNKHYQGGSTATGASSSGSSGSGCAAAACSKTQSDGSSQKCFDLATLRSQAMAKTNELRAKHGAPALTEDSCIDGLAQAYAEHLASTNSFSHSSSDQRAGCGENLYYSGGWSGYVKTANGGDGIQSWYDEEKDYNFQTGQSKNGGVVGHFTQLVWISTTKVGHGFAANSDCSKIYLVGNYDPAGNMGGAYTSNVHS